MALDCGVPADAYWDLTLREVVDIIESGERKRKEEISRLFTLADAISSRVGFIFSDPKKRNSSDIIQPWDCYPELFKDEKAKAYGEDEDEESNIADPELEAYKARMAIGIARWNKRFEERKETEDESRDS